MRERREQERFARYSSPTAGGWYAQIAFGKRHNDLHRQLVSRLGGVTAYFLMSG